MKSENLHLNFYSKHINTSITKKKTLVFCDILFPKIININFLNKQTNKQKQTIISKMRGSIHTYFYFKNF